MIRPLASTGSLAVALSLVGCATADAGGSAGRIEPSSTVTTSTPAPPTGPSTPASPAPTSDDTDDVVGTVIRFSTGGASVDVTIDEDNPTTRDLVGSLPTTLRFEEFAGREKIAYPESGLAVEGSPGSDPEDGDLIYFTPWGNLGFYYDASGIDYSDSTIHLGTYEATADQLAIFDGTDVTLDVID